MYDELEKELEECVEQVRREVQEMGYVALALSVTIVNLTIVVLLLKTSCFPL